MGRATRWLRNLFSSKKNNSANVVSCDQREKKRWSFKTPRDSCETEHDNAAWIRSFYSESEIEQNKKAIAVAAASAAAADAAVAAAQAAVAVVHLTSHSCRTKIGDFDEWFAAVKIQRVFRGYLAKKALRALKALVKLQALVRGYLVRKQTAATFHSMQALIKAQETIRAEKFRSLLSSKPKFHLEELPRISMEKSSFPQRKLSTNLNNTNYVSENSPKVVQMDSFRLKPKTFRRSNYFNIDNSDEISFSSPLPNIAKISIQDCRSSFEKNRYSTTAQSTPRCNIAPSTPTKSLCGEFQRKFVSSTNCPNYMNNTQCFEAKVRSQSTPKQRPDLILGSSKRIPLSELILEQSRASLSSLKMRKNEEEFSFKRTVVGRIDKSLDLSRGERDFYLQNKW